MILLAAPETTDAGISDLPKSSTISPPCTEVRLSSMLRMAIDNTT